MKINIDVEGKFNKIVDERVKQIKITFWRELEKLRKRIVILETKNADANKRLKLVRKNEI